MRRETADLLTTGLRNARHDMPALGCQQTRRRRTAQGFQDRPGARGESIHLADVSGVNRNHFKGKAVGYIGWYKPIEPPPGSRSFVMEPHRASSTSEKWTFLFAREAISAFKSLHMR